MKLINIILAIVVLIATVSLVIISVEGNRLFGATGLALLYFAGAAGYFINCYTFRRS